MIANTVIDFLPRTRSQAKLHTTNLLEGLQWGSHATKLGGFLPRLHSKQEPLRWAFSAMLESTCGTPATPMEMPNPSPASNPASDWCISWQAGEAGSVGLNSGLLSWILGTCEERISKCEVVFHVSVSAFQTKWKINKLIKMIRVPRSGILWFLL